MNSKNEGRLVLTAAGNYYDRTEFLINGFVKPEGIDLRYLVLPPEEACWRMFDNYPFDVSEGSLSSYIVAKMHSEPIVALPVFPYRSFRHSTIFYSVKSGIKSPRDLEGKKVAVPWFQTTATVWMRAVLEHEYDVPVENIDWLVEREEPVKADLPKRFHIEKIPNGNNADSMLAKGEIDAAMWTGDLPSLRQYPERVKRLFPNYKELEIDYYHRTGIFPIMHTLIVKENLLKDHQWVGLSLILAYQKAKEECYRNMLPIRYSLAWARALIAEERQLLGADPYPYNIRDNQKLIETFTQYSYEQGLIGRIPSVKELFFNIELL